MQIWAGGMVPREIRWTGQCAVVARLPHETPPARNHAAEQTLRQSLALLSKPAIFIHMNNHTNTNQTPQTPQTLTIGRKFWDDHISRDLRVPTVIRETAHRVTILVDPDSNGYIDLYSDAMYYSDFNEDPDPWMRGLGKAALRVSNAMYEAAYEWRLANDDRYVS